VTLFRVDVLNIMGPAMVGVGLLWGAGGTVAARVVSCAVAAAAIGMLTPIVRSVESGRRASHLAAVVHAPAGDLTIFTLFPWAGFVFAGGAVGALLAATRDERAERRLHLILGAFGAVLIAFGFYMAGRPSIYRVSSFWTSSPTWFRDPRRDSDGRRVGGLRLVADSPRRHEIPTSQLVFLRAFVLSWQRRWLGWDAARCSSTGSTWSWSTATRPG
jgi:hypothetical protein